jgi:hypothetical protein
VAYRYVSSLFLLLLLSITEVTAQNRPVGQPLCQSITSLLQASSDDFNPVKRSVTRHRDGSTDWEPSIKVAGAQECSGQSDPDMSSSVSCTMAESQSVEEVTTAYRNMVTDIRSCLDRSFVYEEKQGGKASRMSTPVKEATFEVKGKGGSPDGPAVRVSLTQFHRATRSGYELTVWVDGKDKE